MIVKFITETGQKWEKGLKYTIMAYNQAFHSSIGMIPSEVLFSRPPRVPERFFGFQTPTQLNINEKMEKNFRTERACMYEIQQE